MKPLQLLLALIGAAILGVGALLYFWGGTSAGPALSPSAPAAVAPAANEAGAPLASLPGESEGQALADRRATVPVDGDAEAKAPDEPEVEEEWTGPFLRGQVVDENDIPVVGAQVEVTAEGVTSGMLELVDKYTSTVTTTNGLGTFEAPRKKQIGQGFEVKVLARGYLGTTDTRVPDTERGDAQLGRFVVQTATVLGGIVVDANGDPIAGADVRRTTPERENTFDDFALIAGAFSGTDNLSRTKTDLEGRFELAHEEPGDYVLLVRHGDYPGGRFVGKTPPLGQEDMGLVLQLAPTAAISGRIEGFPEGRKHIIVRATERATGDEEINPIDVLMEMTDLSESHNAKVEPDGTFELTGLDVGVTYEVQAFGNDGFFERTACSDAQSTNAGTEGVELVWDAGACVKFVVRDSTTSRALPAVVVRYLWATGEDDWSEAKKRDFENATVELGELRPDPSPSLLTFAVSAPGYRTHFVEDLSVAEDQAIDLGVVELDKAPTLRVRVVDDSGAPVRRARAYLQPIVDEMEETQAALVHERSAQKTDSDGWCELPAVDTPTATLVVSKLGFADYRNEGVRMPTAGASEELVQLTRGGEVDVTVRDSAGEPVGGATVRHQGPEGQGSSKTTNSKGAARFKDLSPGTHRFRAERPSGGSSGQFVVVTSESDSEDIPQAEVWQSVTVSPSDVTSLVLRVRLGAEISGRVTANGSPVANAQVMLLDGWESSAEEEAQLRLMQGMSAFMPADQSQARTDVAGTYQISEAPTGPCRVRVTRDGRGLPHIVQVEIREGENVVDVELPTGVIEGRVVDAAGSPIEGANVRVERALEGEEGEEDLEELVAVSELFGGSRELGVRTDPGGEFTVDGLAPDTEVVLHVSARGYVAGRSEKLEVKENGVRRGVEIALTSGGSIRVQLEGEADGPFQMVTARYAGDQEPKPGAKMVLAAKGTAMLRDLAPGPWRVHRSEQDDESQLVEVRAGEESFLSLGP